MNEIPTMLGQGAFNRSLRNKVGQNKVYLYHRTRPTVSMISALFPTVSDRSPSGFVHPLPCKIMNIPGARAPKVRGGHAVSPSSWEETERCPVRRMKEDPARKSCNSRVLVSSVTMFFCCNWCVLSYAAAGVGFLSSNAGTYLCPIEAYFRFATDAYPYLYGS